MDIMPGGSAVQVLAMEMALLEMAICSLKAAWAGELDRTKIAVMKDISHNRLAPKVNKFMSPVLPCIYDIGIGLTAYSTKSMGVENDNEKLRLEVSGMPMLKFRFWFRLNL